MYTRFISGIRMQREDIKKKKKKNSQNKVYCIGLTSIYYDIICNI